MVTKLNMEYDSETGKFTFFVGCARRSFNISDPEDKEAFKSVHELYRLFRFAYSQGVNDATETIRQGARESVEKLILER